MLDLVEDIRQYGLREALEIDSPQSLRLIRGSQRLRAITALQWETVEVIYREEAWEETDLIEYLIKDNLHRRHLTTEQQYKAGRKLKEVYAQQAERRMQANLKRGSMPPVPLATLEATGPTRDRVAKDLGISDSHFERMEKVFESGNDEIIDKVRRGEIGILTAAQEVDLHRRVTAAEPLADDDNRAKSLLYFRWQQQIKQRLQVIERSRDFISHHPPDSVPDEYHQDAYKFIQDMDLRGAAERLCATILQQLKRGVGNG